MECSSKDHISMEPVINGLSHHDAQLLVPKITECPIIILTGKNQTHKQWH
jgi:hypothetical protein